MNKTIAICITILLPTLGCHSTRPTGADYESITDPSAGWEKTYKTMTIISPECYFDHVLKHGQPYLLATGSYAVVYVGLDLEEWIIRDRFDIEGKTVYPIGCVLSSEEEGEYLAYREVWMEAYNHLVINHYKHMAEPASIDGYDSAP